MNDTDAELMKFHKRKLIEIIHKLKQILAESDAQLVQVMEDAVTDPLTKLLNRRGLELAMGRLWAEMSRAAHDHRYFPASVMLIDLDGLKELNDTHGHAAGDQALVTVANLFASRPADVSGRLGGDEFLLMLANVDVGQARTRAQRLCQEIEESLCSEGITASIGVYVIDYRLWVTVLNSSDPAADMFAYCYERADAALYRAKQAGRNCVQF